MDIGNYIYINDTFGYNPESLLTVPKYRGYLETILITQGMIKDRVEKLAHDIIADNMSNDIIFLCVLRGAFRFAKDLIDKIDNITEITGNNYELQFIRARSYVNDTQEAVTVEGLENLNLEGKHVVIIEDMVDRGQTLLKVSEVVRKKGPISLKIAVLVYKRNPENNFLVPNYIGFSLPNKWIVGYNVDFNGHFRDYPHIAVLNDAGKQAFRV